MRKTFVSTYHNARVVLDVTDGATLTTSQVKNLEKSLCGMEDCNCNFYPVISDDGRWKIYKNGEVLADDAAKAAAAMGRSKSPAKAAAARENGKAPGAGWPKGKARKPAQGQAQK